MAAIKVKAQLIIVLEMIVLMGEILASRTVYSTGLPPVESCYHQVQVEPR